MYNQIINNMKFIIKEKGIKQCVIAQRAGFSEKKFSNLLNGRYIAKADDIPPICNALEVTPNELLLFGTENQSKPQRKVC